MLCSQCGKTIEKDDAQFCNNCGAPVQLQSSMAQSSERVDQSALSSNQPDLSSKEKDESARGQKNQYAPLREQIAEQPGARRQSPASVRVPAPKQMSKEHPGEERPALKEQMAHIRPPSRPIPPATATKPETPPDAGKQSTDHDLQAVHPVRPHSVEWPGNLPSTPPLTRQKDSEEEDIEDRPTQLIPSPPPPTEQKGSKEEEDIEDRPTQRIESLPPTERKDGKEEKKPVEERTTQLIAYKASEDAPAGHFEDTPTAPFAYNKQDSRQDDRASRADAASSLAQQSRPSAVPAMPQQGNGRPGVASADMAASALRVASSRLTERRVPRWLVAAVLVALVLLGGGIWIIVAQPFSVPAITQPQVDFDNSTLHISLLYPNGWMYTVSTSQSTVLFHDSSNTAQMTIVSANATGNNLSTYLQSQADRVGIATPKTLSSETFAGATWQRVQGTVQQKGANYTCTVYATVQSDRLITIIQQAPQTTYDEEDNLVFSQMRASLKLS